MSEGSERRAHPRKLVCVAAYVAVEGDPARMAVVRDVSVTGALLLTRAKPELGEPVELQLYLDVPDSPEELKVRAKTIRVEPLEPERRGPWAYSVALAFEDDLQEHEALLDALASRLAASGQAPP